MPTTTSAPSATALSTALAHIERQLYSLHHQIRLVVDVATAGQSGTLDGLRLETLAVGLCGFADRIEALHADIETLNTANTHRQPVVDLRPHLEWALRQIKRTKEIDRYAAAQAALAATQDKQEVAA